MDYLLLPNAKTIEEADSLIKKKFPEISLLTIKPAELQDFWELIENGLTYILKEPLRFQIDEKEEERVKNNFQNYKNSLEEFIKHESQIFYFTVKTGLPTDRVFWNYEFVIINSDGNSIFIYSAALD